MSRKSDPYVRHHDKAGFHWRVKAPRVNTNRLILQNISVHSLTSVEDLSAVDSSAAPRPQLRRLHESCTSPGRKSYKSEAPRTGNLYTRPTRCRSH